MLISAPKSTVMLFIPDPLHAKTHQRIVIEDSQLLLVQCPKILGVYLGTSLLFNKHRGYVAETVSSRNNILKALEYKPTQHKPKHPIYTKRGSKDYHWLSQDVQCRPPTCRN